MSNAQRVPVSISLMPDQLAVLDQLAADLDRPRSWVVARAIDNIISPRRPGVGHSQVAEPPLQGCLLSPEQQAGANPGGGGCASQPSAGRGNHFTDAIDRQLAHDAAVAADQRRVADDVAARNRGYLEKLGMI